MRIMFGTDIVEEFITIDATEGYIGDADISIDAPDCYSVSMFRYMTEHAKKNGIDEWMPIGEYKMDGTMDTYLKAKANFEMICEKLLTQGWCRDTDFENFEWI